MNENPPLEVPVSNRMALCAAAARAIDQLNNADPEVVIVNPIGAIRMSSGRKYSLRLVAMDEERVQEVTLGPKPEKPMEHQDQPLAPAVALWNKVIDRATGKLKEDAKWGRPKELLDEDDKLHLVVEFPIESGPEEHMRRLQGPLQQILNEVTVKRATLTHVQTRAPLPAPFVWVERKQHICGHFKQAKELVRRVCLSMHVDHSIANFIYHHTTACFLGDRYPNHQVILINASQNLPMVINRYRTEKHLGEVATQLSGRKTDVKFSLPSDREEAAASVRADPKEETRRWLQETWSKVLRDSRLSPNCWAVMANGFPSDLVQPFESAVHRILITLTGMDAPADKKSEWYNLVRNLMVEHSPVPVVVDFIYKPLNAVRTAPQNDLPPDPSAAKRRYRKSRKITVKVLKVKKGGAK